MTELGFHPSGSFEADRVTFYKDYADDVGHRVRAYAFFDKPVLGMHDFRLANFVITLQTAIAPTQEAVAEEAPTVIRSDLLGVLESFQSLVGRIPEQAVAARECAKCHKKSAEFFIVNSDAICKTCVDERANANGARR
jgi:hypothetical protein